MILVVDFTKEHRRFLTKLTEYLYFHNIPFTVAASPKMIQEAAQKTSFIILSGSEMYIADAVLDQHYRAMFRAVQKIPKTVPRLGICFGAQFLYYLEGGKLLRMKRFICARRKLLTQKETVKFCLHEVFEEPCPSAFTYTEWARLDGELRPCAIKHKKYPWTGLLFHPEETWDMLSKYLP